MFSFVICLILFGLVLISFFSLQSFSLTSKFKEICNRLCTHFSKTQVFLPLLEITLLCLAGNLNSFETEIPVFRKVKFYTATSVAHAYSFNQILNIPHWLLNQNGLQFTSLQFTELLFEIWKELLPSPFLKKFYIKYPSWILFKRPIFSSMEKSNFL